MRDQKLKRLQETRTIARMIRNQIRKARSLVSRGKR